MLRKNKGTNTYLIVRLFPPQCSLFRDSGSQRRLSCVTFGVGERCRSRVVTLLTFRQENYYSLITWVTNVVISFSRDRSCVQGSVIHNMDETFRRIVRLGQCLLVVLLDPSLWFDGYLCFKWLLYTRGLRWTRHVIMGRFQLTHGPLLSARSNVGVGLVSRFLSLSLSLRFVT